MRQEVENDEAKDCEANTHTARELAPHILAAFNDLAEADPDYSSRTWLSMIGDRCDEHPELALEDHRQIIAAFLSGKRWWTVQTSPSLIYGKAEAFERALQPRTAASRKTDRYRRTRSVEDDGPQLRRVS
jgi:hypothetical protein